jgi:hypothetical protein
VRFDYLQRPQANSLTSHLRGCVAPPGPHSIQLSRLSDVRSRVTQSHAVIRRHTPDIASVHLRRANIQDANPILA